jgi:hypothetical protein
LYDLGHFHLHDGHRLAVPGLQWLLDGYRQGAELPADHEQQMAVYGLLIGVPIENPAVQSREPANA